jgi:hypothetical protein
LNAADSSPGHLQPDQDAAVVGALVAVVEQADVPVGLHQAQELEQRARAFGEHEAQQALVVREAGAPADQMAQVLLGEFVVREVERVEAVLVEGLRNGGRLAAREVVRPTNTWALAASLMR